MSKKILLVSTLLSGHGGMETVIRTFCTLMSESGVEVKLVFLGKLKSKNKLDWLEGLDYEILSQSKQSVFFLRCLSEFFSIVRIKKEWDPDITLALNAGAIRILHYSNYLGKKKKIIDWVHFSLEIIRKKELLKLADFHFAISKGIQTELEGELGIPTKFIEVIYNPVDTKNIFLIPRPKNDTIKLLYVGRLTAQKDVFLLLKACSLISERWELHIVGDGEDKKQLIKYSYQLGIDSYITWHGWQKQPWIYVRDNIGEVSALVLTSKNEGFPMVLVEACAHGIFCIATDCKTGPSDIINSANGILCPVEDYVSISVAIGEIRTKLKSVSQDEVVESIFKFDSQHYCMKVLTCIERILGTVKK